MPSRTRGNTRADVERLRMALLDMEDDINRLLSLCHLGGLAAEGMHGLGRNPDATALACYFILLRVELESLRAACRALR